MFAKYYLGTGRGEPGKPTRKKLLLTETLASSSSKQEQELLRRLLRCQERGRAAISLFLPFYKVPPSHPPKGKQEQKNRSKPKQVYLKSKKCSTLGKYSRIFYASREASTGSRARTRRRLYFRPQDRRRSNGRNGEWSECEWEAIALSDLFKRKGRKEGGGEEEVISKGKKGKKSNKPGKSRNAQKMSPFVTCNTLPLPENFLLYFCYLRMCEKPRMFRTLSSCLKYAFAKAIVSLPSPSFSIFHPRWHLLCPSL